MPRLKMVNGIETPFTDQEEVQRDTEEAAFADGVATTELLGAIADLEQQETPRRIAEATLTAEGKAWLQANRDAIALERAKL
tara:strand:- start:1010 stop:1255 length:246 start_codon:yes stop_codon:yes gene_type:complete